MYSLTLMETRLDELEARRQRPDPNVGEEMARRADAILQGKPDRYKEKKMITSFYDMSSGGSEKEDWTFITVNLPEDEAVEWFEETFGHHPFDVACECCGQNYSSRTHESLEEFVNYWDEPRSHKHFEV